MKWIGQHIWDFISRFRNDVYLEDVSDGAPDRDKFLCLDGNGKVVRATPPNTTYSEATGTAEGLMSIAHHDKLDGIEASADVTDATNVTAAGALMDSEVTNLAQVKAFSSADYATAAQGAKADSAQQPPSEGAFANGDKTKLNGIASGAEVNVQSDWNATGGDEQILNKPTIPVDLTVSGTGGIHVNNVPTLNQSTTGNAATATLANTAGSATNAGHIAVTANADDEEQPVPFLDRSTGDATVHSDAGITYNPHDNALTTTTFIGALNGNANTVTTNANLTGHITSSGNATTLGSFTLAQLNTAVTGGTIGNTHTLSSRFHISSSSHNNYSGAFMLLPFSLWIISSIDSANYTSQFIAPKAGKVSSITYVYERNHSVNREFKLYKNGSTTNFNTGGTMQISSHTTGSNYASKHTESCPADWTFAQNDRVAIAFKDNSYTENNIMSILIEYDN